LSALAFLALAPFAHADSIYVYDLNAPSGLDGNVVGSITIEGNDGAAVPLLDSADVLSFAFHYTGPGGVQFNDAVSAGRILGNSMNFNGTLGDSVLEGTSGAWEIGTSQSNTALFLYGTPTGAFEQYWGICRPDATLACTDTGDYHVHWTLTLSSVTDNPAPEPATVWLGLGVVAAFCVKRAVRA